MIERILEKTILKKLNKYDEAIKCYDKVIKLDANYSLAYYYKGNSLDSLSKYEEAIKCYNRAIKCYNKEERKELKSKKDFDLIFYALFKSLTNNFI